MIARVPDNPWTIADDAELARLWAQGISSAQIGLRMGRTKNSVISRAHRIALNARQSPIIRDGSAPSVRKRRSCRQLGSTLPAIQTLVVVAVGPPEPVCTFRAPSSHPCCWPIGEPGTKAFRFCDAPSRPGKSYCAEHCEKAYVKPPRGMHGDHTLELYLAHRVAGISNAR